MRTCPNGHPIDDDRARICPACGSPEVHPAPARRERISAPALGLSLAVIAVAIGLFAAWMALQQPRPLPSSSTSPQAHDGGPTVIVG